ncbi:MAG: class I SAM-dependent methyltransferase, partial [Rhodococcus sp. (in: high G+C Gram-positive bacteria)]
MGYDFTLADVAYLTSDDGRDALASVADRELSTRTRLADIGWARTRFGDRAGMLVETVILRRKAEAKIAGGAGWVLTDDALQQSTPTRVAAHRAERLRGRTVHDVTCSIGAELTELVGVAETVIG